MLLVSHFVPLITNTMTSETRLVESSTLNAKVHYRTTHLLLLFDTLSHLRLKLLLTQSIDSTTGFIPTKGQRSRIKIEIGVVFILIR